MIRMIKTYLHAIVFMMLLYNNSVSATIIAKGDATNGIDTFTKLVVAKVFDRATGTLYVGIEVASTVRNGEETPYNLSKATRLVGNLKPIFTPIGTNVAATIEFLTLATQTGDTSPFLPFVELNSTAPLKQTIVNIVKNDGSTLQTSAALKDAAGADTTGIVGLAANKSFIFAAVRPTGDLDFGAQNGGIAVVSINPTTIELDQTAAQLYDTGSKAIKLDPTTPEIKINNAVDFSPDNTVDLFWDDPLQRLYIGLPLVSNAAPNSGAKSVVVARVTEQGKMIFQEIAPDTAFGLTTDFIVGVKLSSQPVTAKHVRVMHCSTGPSYLIVNGGNAAYTSANNTVYSLPLVDDPTNVATHGTLADYDAALTNFKFTKRAQTNADLLIDTDPEAKVGAGRLPIEPTTEISDIVVVGDTVYVSIDVSSTSTNDGGVFYSEALFDEDGKIIRWTPWSKRALPFDAFPKTATSKGRIKFFDVDAVTGKLWAVEGINKTAVCSTAWDFGTNDATTLPSCLNAVFNQDLCNKGCFSVLDLDQSTRGFIKNPYSTIRADYTTTHRYALFGGADKVIFAHISTAYFEKDIWSPQEVTEDFSNPENFLVTTLPSNSGAVHVLEYSRRDQVDPSSTANYFFAGTDHGLFVFANSTTRQGFRVQDLALLDKPPFTTSKWHKIDGIAGAIIDIKTIGNRLYVLTFETSCQTPLKSRLYGINFDNDISSMFATKQLLAESGGTGIFSSAFLFTGIQVIATGPDFTPTIDPLNKEQIVLATNNGLFRSNADQSTGNGLRDANNQTQAKWQQLPAGNTELYDGIAGIDPWIPTTVWPFTIQDVTGKSWFEGSSIQQISASGSNDGTVAIFKGFVPPHFIASKTDIPFNTLPPISNFWTDGARRFFIIGGRNSYCDSCNLNRLLSFPFRNDVWRIVNPGNHFLFDPPLQATKRFYWVHHIGVSGILMAGTDSGIVALE